MPKWMEAHQIQIDNATVGAVLGIAGVVAILWLVGSFITVERGQGRLHLEMAANLCKHSATIWQFFGAKGYETG
jgi:hypothetical protein